MTNAAVSNPLPRFIPAVIRWRLCVLLLWVLGIGSSCVVYLSHFQIDNSVAIWFLDDDPELEAYRRHNAEFGEREWTYVWLRGDPVFSPEFLRDLQLLGERIGSLDGVTQVVSLTEAGGIGTGPDGRPVFEKFHATAAGELPDRAEVMLLRQKIRGSPRFAGRLVPPNSEPFTVLAVQNDNRVDAIDPYRIRLIDEIREAITSHPTILDSGIVGTTMINSGLNRAAKRDMLIYYTLIAAFVLVGGGLALGSLRDVLVLGAVVLGTVLPILGAVSACRLPFNLMTVMLPTLLVTVSVSYLIHFIGEFHAVRREQEDRGNRPNTSSAIASTFGRLLRPGLWTSVTTATGFLSLTVSPVAPIRQIGFFAAAGIGLAWLATITIAPALLSLLWKAGAREHRRASTAEDGNPVLRWLARPRPIFAALLGGAMLAGAAGLVRLEADTNYVNFFRPGSKVRNDYKQLADLGMPGSYLTVTVRVPDPARLTDPARHDAMRRFEHSLRLLPGVIDVQSLDGMVAQLASDHHGRSPPVPVPILLAMATSGRLAAADDFLSNDGGRLRVRVMTGAMSTRDINAFRDRLARLAAEHPGDWEVALTGTNVLWANMDAHVVRTQLQSIGIMAVVLLVLLPLVFRSLVLGILGFVVSFVPVLCTLGLMAWIGLPVNIATCILGGVVMGLAVDDTIYYLSRFREGILQGMPADDAARRATMTSGRAMIKTSLILTGGFLTMAASDFMPSVYFGIFFAFSILVALLADLIVLPSLLRLIMRKPARTRMR